MPMCGDGVRSLQDADAFPAAQVQPFLDQLPISFASHVAQAQDDGFVPKRNDPGLRLIAGGWPFRSAISALIVDPETEQWHPRGGISVPSNSPYAHVPNNLVVPYRPLWIGTVLNSILYSAPVFFLWMVVVGGRRLRRFERGHCPRCNFDLRHDLTAGCPECGWRRIVAVSEQ